MNKRQVAVGNGITEGSNAMSQAIPHPISREKLGILESIWERK